MNTTTTSSLVDLSSDALVQRLQSLLGEERRTVVSFLFHLAEVKRRRAFEALGYSSLFVYCTRALGLSNGSAFRRTTAVDLLARFPITADYLADGRLNLTNLVHLRDVLGPDSHLRILDEASGLSEESVKELVARLQPRPDVHDSLRRAPIRSAPAPSLLVSPEPSSPRPSPTPGASPASPPQPPRSQTLAPLNAEKHLLRLSVGKEFRADFERVISALGHVVPSGSYEEVLHECIRIALDACEGRRIGSKPRAPRGAKSATSGPEVIGSTANSSAEVSATSGPEVPYGSATSGPEVGAVGSTSAAPRTSGPEVQALGAEHSRYIPVEVRRAVWARDAGQCAFIGLNGHRCGSTRQLEFHHRVPFARGGASTAENLSLACRAHNRFYARADFGDEHMARFDS